MAVSLRPMAGEEIADFLAESRAGYIEERVASGVDPHVAARAADRELEAAFPNGEPGPGHTVYRVEADGERVGSLWIGPVSDDRLDTWWVWDVAIDPPHRRRGLGRHAMVLAEEEARARGATHLGLSVSSDNEIARRLYEGLGYATTSVRMSKRL